MKTYSRQIVAPRGRFAGRRGAAWLAGTVGLTLVMLAGCTKQVEEVPTLEVKTVQAYDQTLGADASLQQVAYVLLRALADDVAAAQAGKSDEQKAAQDLAFSLCAPSVMERRLVSAASQLGADAKKADLGDERDAKLYKTVHFWAPIVAHYVESFDTDPAAAAAKMWVLIDADEAGAHVYYSASHDPQETDPAKKLTATIDIEMAKETGVDGVRYWRVARVAFLGRQFKSPQGSRIIDAYGQKLDASATPQQVVGVTLQTMADLIRVSRTGSKDEQTAAMWRLMWLIDGNEIARRARGGDDPQAAADTPGAAEHAKSGQIAERIIGVWISQVARFAHRLDTDIEAAATHMKAMELPAQEGAARKAQVLYQIPAVDAGGEGAEAGVALIGFDLIERKAGADSIWRVVNIAALTPQTHPGATAKPATVQPATPATQPISANQE